MLFEINSTTPIPGSTSKVSVKAPTIIMFPSLSFATDIPCSPPFPPIEYFNSILLLNREIEFSKGRIFNY